MFNSAIRVEQSPAHANIRRAFYSGATLLAMCALISCGTVPIPKRPGEAVTQAQVTAKPLTKPATAAATTTTTTSVPPATTSTTKPPADPIAIDTVSAKEHIQNAVALLQTGKEMQARLELNTALQKEPDNKIGKNLLSQIDADPALYFPGRDSFPYTVQPGESLSIVARRFLDDALKFHILAKYNGITDPSRLDPGQTIRIPGKKPPEMPTPVEEAHVQQAKRLYDLGKYQDSIEVLEGAGSDSNDARDLLVLSYVKYAEELVQKANLLDAQSILEKAVSIQPSNDKLKKQLKQVEKQREVSRVYKSGTDALTAGEREKALEAFRAVLKLDPNHEAAKKQVAGLKSDVVEAMHKEAMIEYRRQDLDKAIETWDSVLVLDPGHELAKLYRARAVELKEKLEKLDKK